MSDEIDIKELNVVVKDNTQCIENANKVIQDLKDERERVRIGFLDSETPRLMSLLTDTINLLETLNSDLIKRTRELKRFLRKERKLKKEIAEKPTPLIEPIPKREEKKRKALGKTFIPSRKHPIVT